MQETQEMQVWSLGREEPLDGHGNPLQDSCLKNPTEEPGVHSPQGCIKSDTTYQLKSNKITTIIALNADDSIDLSQYLKAF